MIRQLSIWGLLFGIWLSSAPFVSAQTTASKTSTLQWRTCPPPPEGIPDAGMQCATLTVPLDYRVPNGKKIPITISRIITSKPELHRGVLLSNPGGPGGQGLDLPRLFTIIMPQSILDRYDLISFDPRGVGTSNPLTCNATSEEEARAVPPYPYPLLGGFKDTVAFLKTIAEKCTQATGSNLQFFTTANTARDMEQIRKAVDEPKISYLGYSYGTYLGAVYASLFPSRVDRFVLDSSVNPNWVWREQFRSFGSATEIRFPDFATFVAENNETYQLGSTPSEVRTNYLTTARQLDSDPLENSDGNVITGNLFRETIRGGLHADVSFPDTAAFWQAINEARASDAINLQKSLAAEPTTSTPSIPVDNFLASNHAIICDDAAWPRSLDQYFQDVITDDRNFPIVGGMAGNAWACAFWKLQPIEQPVKITASGSTNILMLQNDRDPATSLQSGLGLHKALGNRSRMVRADGGDHGMYLLTGNQCIDDKATNFLANGTMPAQDVQCGPVVTNQAQLQQETKNAARDQLRRRMRM